MEVNLGNYFFNSNMLIGRGSFAKVYLGFRKQNNNDEKIAIKVIETVNLNEKQRYPNNKRNMINNEIDILQSVSHTNIVKVFEILLSEKQIFVIMEYCD